MSLHADAVRVLTSWRPADDRQERLRRDYLAYLSAHPDAMWRRCLPAHLTASALVVTPAGDEVLLVRHAKVGRWLQTGGHCEPGDPTLAATALREATEESGIEGLRLLPRPIRLDRHVAPCGAEHHLDVQFLAVTPHGRLPAPAGRPQTGEDPVAWFPIDRLPAATDESVRRLVRDSIKCLDQVGKQIVGVLEAD